MNRSWLATRRDLHPALRRRPWVSVPVALVAVAVLFVAPAAPSFNHTDLSPALQVSCASFTRPTTVAGLNRVVSGYRSQQRFTGGDVGASAELTDGRQLFAFGDTLRGRSYSSTRYVRNSMLVFGPGCAGVVQRRDRGAVIPDRGDGVGYWPMSVVRTGRGHGVDLVTVTAQRVRSTGGGGLFGFENLGPAVAQFTVRDGGVPVLQWVRDIGADSPDTRRPTWGAATTRVGNTLYLYGTANPGDGTVGWSLSVARTSVSTVTDPSTWRYWDGSAWQRDPARAAVLIPAHGGVSQTLSVFRQGGTWYALSKRGDFLGTDLVAWTAPAPTGPFTAGPVLARIPSTSTSGHDADLRYLPLAHPELLPETGTVVVSVSRNTTDGAAIEENPTLYRPEFLRVALPRLTNR